MRLINTTSSHAELVQGQLTNTDATLVETYSAGNTDVVFTQAPYHFEILISNKYLVLYIMVRLKTKKTMAKTIKATVYRKVSL